MKAKTLMGMIACASACVSLSAFGNTTNDWFGVTVDTDITPVNCSTNGAAVSVENSKIVLDNDYATKLEITPAVALTATNSTNIAKIDVVALLTPSSTNDLAVIDDAKAGFAVGIDDQNQTNYYGYANGVWHKLTGGTPAKDVDTTFSIIINYRDTNVIYVADNVNLTPAPLTIASGSSFTAIDAFGSGSITSVNSKFEEAVCAVGTAKYGSLAEAIEGGGNTGTIVDVNANGTTGSSTAANGLSVAVCKALGISTTEANTPAVPITPAESDISTSSITFALAESVTVADGVTVKFAVKKSGTQVGELQSHTQIQIPLSEGSGVYTFEPVGVQ